MKRKVEAQLIAWKNKSSERQPLLVNGARQVGKTYILRKFGEEQFKNVVYVNLETNLTIASYFNDNIAPERLLRYLEASTGERIIAGETLIFFDEIQSCERALTSLKYFCEETPEFHIAAAGSLLGVAINRQHYSFPAGQGQHPSWRLWWFFPHRPSDLPVRWFSKAYLHFVQQKKSLPALVLYCRSIFKWEKIAFLHIFLDLTFYKS